MLIFGHGTEEPGNRINSRKSFVALAKLGIDGVELDVRSSRDGELLVIHDHVFEDGRPVAETLGKPRPQDVSFLEEALDLCRGMIVNVEIKNYLSDPAFDVREGISERVMALLDARRNVDRVLISCFGIASLDRFQSERPDLETAHLVLSRRPAEEVVKTCIEHGHLVIHPYVSMIDERFMEVARSHDLRVNAWTNFDETDEMIRELIACKVDGVITPFPERALRLTKGGEPSSSDL